MNTFTLNQWPSKLTLGLVIFFAISNSLFSQITIEAADFPGKGDTVRYSITNNIFSNFTATGANYSWNFANLSAQSQTLVNHQNPDQADFITQSLFGSTVLPTYRATYYLPAKELPLATVSALVDLPIEEIYRFYRKTNSEMTVVGLSIAAMGFAIGKRADVIEIAYKYPMVFGQSYTSNGFVNLDLSAFAPFSLKQYRERESEVDGWGTITTSYGTFECLRIHHKINELDSILIDLGQGAEWYPIDIPLIHEYEWWAKDQKGPILKAKANEIFGFPVVNEVMFRDKFRPNLNVSLEENENDVLQIHPNPTEDYLFFQNIDEGATMIMLNAQGQQVMKQTATSQIDIRELSSGVYFIVFQKDGRVTMPQRFVKK